MQVYSELSVVTFLQHCSRCWRRRRWQWTWQAGYSWYFHYRISVAWQQKRTISEPCCHGFAWCILWVFGLWRGDKTIYEWWREWATWFSNTHRTVATGNWPAITINWAKLIHLTENLVNAICNILRTWMHSPSVANELLWMIIQWPTQKVPYYLGGRVRMKKNGRGMERPLRRP